MCTYGPVNLINFWITWYNKTDTYVFVNPSSFRTRRNGIHIIYYNCMVFRRKLIRFSSACNNHKVWHWYCDINLLMTSDDSINFLKTHSNVASLRLLPPGRAPRNYDCPYMLIICLQRLNGVIIKKNHYWF